MGIFTSSSTAYVNAYTTTSREYLDFRTRTTMRRSGKNDETLSFIRNNVTFHSMLWSRYTELISQADMRNGQAIGTEGRWFVMYHYLKDNHLPTRA